MLEIIYPKTNSKAYSPKVQVVPITKTELLLDIKKEVISTILSYLELYGYLELLPTCLITCSLQLLKSQMDILAGQSKLFKWILDYSKKTKGIFEFDLFEAAKKLETELDNIQQELFSFQVISSFIFLLNFLKNVSSMKKKKFDMN